MDTIMYKKELLNKLLVVASGKELIAKKNQQQAQSNANEEEGAMQSRYSTFKEEGQYLAGGLRGLHEEFKMTVGVLRSLISGVIKDNNRVESLAIVDLQFENESIKKFFVLPVLGGEKVDDLTIITPTTPLGKAILRKEIGDDFAFQVAGKIRKGEVINVI